MCVILIKCKTSRSWCSVDKIVDCLLASALWPPIFSAADVSKRISSCAPKYDEVDAVEYEWLPVPSGALLGRVMMFDPDQCCPAGS